jgi:purine nucleosidase/non-specific riboncleoside hydrolase
MAHRMTGQEVESLFQGQTTHLVGAFSYGLWAHVRRVAQGFGRGDVFQFVDPFAAAVLIEPELVTSSLTASVDVSLAPGISRGMTVVDPSGRLGTPPVTLVQSGNLDRLKALYSRSVAWQPALPQSET